MFQDEFLAAISTFLWCKGRVEPLDSGRDIAQEDCQMLQKYAVCPEHLSATLMFRTAAGLVSLHTYGQTLLEIAGKTHLGGQLHVSGQVPGSGVCQYSYNSNATNDVRALLRSAYRLTDHLSHKVPSGSCGACR